MLTFCLSQDIQKNVGVFPPLVSAAVSKTIVGALQAKISETFGERFAKVFKDKSISTAFK